MSTQSIYRTPQGEKKLLDIYDRQLTELEIEYDRKNVDTRFGHTNVLEIGSPEKQKVVIFHGGNSTNPYNLKGFLPLLEEFQIFAPDTIGHPGYSAQVVLSSKDDSYGQWAADVITGLNLTKPNCVGVSYGGGILARLAAFAPELISSAVFIVPSGIANNSLLKILIKLGLPMIKYRLFPGKENLIKAVAPMTNTKEIDEDTLEMVEAVFKHVKVDAEMPRNATEEELGEFTAPTLVIAAEKDVIFPGRAVIKRSKEIFSNSVKTELLDKSPHMFFQRESDVKKVNNLVANFILSSK